MPRVDKTPLAENDLLEIVGRIAATSPASAEKLLDRFDKLFALYAASPEAAARFQPRSRYRHFTVGVYVVFYVPQVDGIQISRVLHGARDLPDLLEF
jgi:toxin ParE1/3/4